MWFGLKYILWHYIEYPLNFHSVFRQLYQNLDHVSMCIDGSIESSVVIHLVHIFKTQLHSNDKLQVVYFKEKQSADLEEFIKEMTDK